MPMKLTRLNHYNGAFTHADLWKSLALLLMVIDHIGWLFFPDDLTWRAIGRASMPIWCFFIGYHCTSRDGEPLKSDWHEMKPLLIGTGIMTLANFITGHVELLFLPLPILATFIAIKWLLKQDTIRRAMTEYPYEWLVAMALLAIPSIYLLEYGSLALLFASAGYMHKRGWLEDSHPNHETLRRVALFSVALYLFLQWGNFEFSTPNALLMTSLILPITYGLWRYHPGEATLPAAIPAQAKLIPLLKLGGRYTLEFYVAHKVVLQIIAMN